MRASRTSVPRKLAAAAISSPFGLNAIRSAEVRPRKPVSVRRRTSHTRSGRRGPSPASAAASSLPLGEKASAWESRRIPLSSPAGASVRAFHRVRRPPSPVTASRRPSGLKATEAAVPSSARTLARRRRVRVSIRSTAPSLCVRARVRPSGLIAIPRGVCEDVEAPPDGEAPVEPPVAGQVPEDRARIGRPR